MEPLEERLQPLMVLVAGPYRSGTGDNPALIARNMRAMNEAALALFRMGHVPVTGEAIALPLIATAGSRAIGDAVFDEIFHPVAARLARRCGAAHRRRLRRRRRDGADLRRGGAAGVSQPRRRSAAGSRPAMTPSLWSLFAARASAHAMHRRAAQGQPLVVLVAGPWSWQVGRDPALVARDGGALSEVAARLLDAGHVAVTGEMLALPILAASGRGAAPVDAIMHAIVARIARRCDACLRVGGPSRAADAAARIFEDLGLPVFRRLADVPGCR